MLSPSLGGTHTRFGEASFFRLFPGKRRFRNHNHFWGAAFMTTDVRYSPAIVNFFQQCISEALEHFAATATLPSLAEFRRYCNRVYNSRADSSAYYTSASLACFDKLVSLSYGELLPESGLSLG